MRKYLWAGLGSAVFVALLLWAFMPRPVTVEAAAITRGSLTVLIEAEGEARIREVYTVSAPLGGRLRRIALHAGDAVAVGDVVARIGPSAPGLLDARARAVAEATAAAAGAAVEFAQAQLVQAEAARDFAVTEADRARSLFERAASSQRMLDDALLAQRTAEAAVASARANLSVRQRERDSAEAVLASGTATGNGNGSDDLACCVEITTPVAGRILRVATENDQVVQAGTPILEIGNRENMEIAVDLLSRDAVRVVEGAQAVITGWGGPDLAAVVDRVEPAAVTKVSALGIEEQRVEVILSVTDDPARWALLGHGFRVLARITVWQADGLLTVPVGALFRDGSDWATYVVQDDRAELRKITIGERNEDVAEVLDGLTEGEAVILHPSDAVTTGTRVAAAGG